MYNTRLVRPLKILGALYLAYLALVLLVLTPALNILAPKIYRAQTGGELRLEKIILLNPFTLAATVRGAASDNADHSRFWSFDKLYANVSLSSLWRRQLMLDAVQLQGLYVQIEQTAADRYNFSDILDYRAARAADAKNAAPAETGSGIFPVTIDKIIFEASHLGLRAPHNSEPVALEIAGLAIEIENFSTVAVANAATPNLATANKTPSNAGVNPQAGRTDSAIATLSSGAIHIDIDQIKNNFLREQHPFAAGIDNLQFSMAAFSGAAQTQQYRLNAQLHAGGELKTEGTFNLAAQQNSGAIHIRNFNVVPGWDYLAPRLAFETQRALLDADLPYQLQWGDALAYRVDNGSVALRDVQLQAQHDADTQLGFGALNVDGIGVDSAQARVQIARIVLDRPTLRGWNRSAQISLIDMFKVPSSDASDGPAWQVRIDEVAMQEGHLQWRTDLLDAPELIVAPLQAHATHIQWPATEPAQFDLTASVNTDTQITLRGALTAALDPLQRTGKLSGDIAALPLVWGNRLLGQQISATLQSGSASAHFEVALDKGQPTTVQSDGRIEKFELQRLSDRQKLVAWKQLQWQKLAVNLPAQTLQIDRIVATNPWLQLRLNSDGTNNFQQLTVEHSGGQTAAEQTRAGSQAQTSAPAKKAAAKSSARTATKSTKIPAGTAKPWLFSVRNIHSDNGTLDFRDNSLPRAFHTTIADFTGDLDGLSNRPGSLAKAGFKGTVDGYAPVALTGTVNPFAETPALNIALDITNLDLAALTPYSGTYAGYLINGGRLSVQLAYTLENKRIKGTNHIIVNQLELGEQIKGPKVMDLPLRLAIYLLTDADGVMDLGVDVTGNADDPDFSVASIIWKAFRNVIVKTVSSPFRALGRLVGGGADQDLDRIEFAAGSDHIGETSGSKLNSLAEILQKKSALRINIAGHVSPWQDIEALRDNSLSQQLIAQDGIAPVDIQQQSTRWQQAVAKLYAKRFPADNSGKLVTMQMNDAMRDNVELEPRALDELASRRALAVKQALVTERGLAADRATLTPVDLGADKNPGLHVTFAVE